MHHTANKFLMDFLGFCRRQVGTLQGESLKKTLKFIAVWLMGSITLWLAKESLTISQVARLFSFIFAIKSLRLVTDLLGPGPNYFVGFG